MTVKKINYILVLPMLIFISCFNSAAATDINCNILQYKLDRLYFPIGTEENVYPSNRFTVYAAGDSIYNGIIESSQLGISYSRITHYFFDTIAIDSCWVLIESADIDSTSDIAIGLPDDIPVGPIIGNPPSYSFGDISIISMQFTLSMTAQNGNHIILKHYDSEIDMALDFESGRIDGFFSHSNIITNKTEARIISNYTPYFAAIIPNISRDINDGGLMTRSLYYRFDKTRLSLYFDGDNIRAYSCFYPLDEFCTAQSEYDWKKAEDLLLQLDKFPKEINIYIGDGRLEKLGRYYADVLNRDRIKTTLTHDKDNADIYLMFIPTLAGQIDSSLYYIYNILAGDTIPDGKSNSTVEIMADCLELSRQTTSKEAREYYIKRVLQSLKDEIGAYPLFQPIILFTADKHLRGFGFDPDGYFNLLALTRIRLAGSASENK